MIGFLIKKAFFDMWDNLLAIVVLNVGFILVLGLYPFYTWISGFLPFLNLIFFFFPFMLLYHYAIIWFLAATFQLTNKMADYQLQNFVDFYRALKNNWKHSIVFTVIIIFLIHGLPLIFNFYYKNFNMFGTIGRNIGIFIAFFLLWFALAFCFSLQYFFPIVNRIPGKYLDVFKKSLYLLLDNTGFTIFLAIVCVFILFISGFSIFLIPGISGITLWLNDAFKLRLYKYNYLEENPEADRKKIPWKDLIFNDKERVGKRSLRGMIFPWKD